MKFEPREPGEAINYSREHPLRETAFLFFGLSVAALAAYFVLGWAAEAVVPYIPPAWEQSLFGGVWNRLQGKISPVDSESRQIDLLVARLQSEWPNAPYDFKTGVLDEPDPNALALPGGLILVTRGLLDGVGSENELAFVLGHEMGHFRNRDHLRSLGRGLVTGLLKAAIAAATGMGSADRLDLAWTFSERGFSRAQELAADEFALELVHTLYGHVGGADHFFRDLAEDGAASGRTLPNWLSTHPVSADRIAALSRLARERGWRTEGRLRPPPARSLPP